MHQVPQWRRWSGIKRWARRYVLGFQIVQLADTLNIAGGSQVTFGIERRPTLDLDRAQEDYRCPASDDGTLLYIYICRVELRNSILTGESTTIFGR